MRVGVTTGAVYDRDSNFEPKYVLSDYYGGP